MPGLLVAAREFWRQENKAQRNFQVVFTFLTLNFLIPGLFYAFRPLEAVRQFEALGMFLGGGRYVPLAAERGFLWRILAVGNVLTLSLMCFLLQLDLKRCYPILIPLVFMKACAAFGYLYVYLFVYAYPAFAALFMWDWLTFFVMLQFAKAAHRSLQPPEERPRGRRA